jgi:hypothetical protein
MSDRLPPPPLRKAVAILLLLGGLTVYALVTVKLADVLISSGTIRIFVYAVAGIAWILPARHLMIWMETGKWTLPRKS